MKQDDQQQQDEQQQQQQQQLTELDTSADFDSAVMSDEKSREANTDIEPLMRDNDSEEVVPIDPGPLMLFDEEVFIFIFAFCYN